MRYHYTKHSLTVRGEFRYLTLGGSVQSTAVFELSLNDIRNLCILQYDYITVFAAMDQPDTITLVITSDEGLSDEALEEAAKTAERALGSANLTALITIASEGAVKHTAAGEDTETGSRICSGIVKSREVAAKEKEVNRPSYFIYSRYENTGWFEWKKEGCPYYPCHGIDGQVCDFCYCPFYPCEDESCGEWLASTTSRTGRLWACSNCLLNHDPKRAAYLKQHPDCTFEEFKHAPGIY